MTGKELTDEELQEIADTYGLYTEQDVENRVSCELLRIGARNEDLEKENAELKEVHESDKRSLRLIAEKGAKLEKENTELKEQIEALANVNIKAQNIIGEAKEIIKRLMDIINHDLKCFDTMAGLDIKQKAEQFLKENTTYERIQKAKYNYID